MYNMATNEFSLTDDELKEMVGDIKGWDQRQDLTAMERVKAYAYSVVWFEMLELPTVFFDQTSYERVESVYTAWLNGPNFEKACAWAQAWLDNNKQST